MIGVGFAVGWIVGWLLFHAYRDLADWKDWLFNCLRFATLGAAVGYLWGFFA